MYFKSLNPIDIRQYSNSAQGILDIQSNAHSKKETRGKEDGHLCLPRAGMKGHKYGNSHVYWALSHWGPPQLPFCRAVNGNGCGKLPYILKTMIFYVLKVYKIRKIVTIKYFACVFIHHFLATSDNQLLQQTEGILKTWTSFGDTTIAEYSASVCLHRPHHGHVEM